MVVFPLMTMFLASSVALLRERTTGTLERLMTTPLSRLALLGGYGLIFTMLAVLQAGLVTALSLGALGLSLVGSTALVAHPRRLGGPPRARPRTAGQRLRPHRVSGRAIHAGHDPASAPALRAARPGGRGWGPSCTPSPTAFPGRTPSTACATSPTSRGSARRHSETSASCSPSRWGRSCSEP